MIDKQKKEKEIKDKKWGRERCFKFEINFPTNINASFQCF